MTPEQLKRLKSLYSNQKGPKDQFKETTPDDSEKHSKIGTMHSMLAGVGSGLINDKGTIAENLTEIQQALNA